jgi:hypothetical protein
MVLTIEYRQTLACVSKTNASTLVCWSTVPQSRPIIDDTHFEHRAADPTFDANGTTLFA